MRLTIFGSGYVGLVSGACLADAGNDVLCVDVDPAKIERLKKGDIPIHEPGLDALIARNVAAGRMRFTTDAASGVAHATVQLIAVGTPPDETGSADLKHVLAVARTIGTHMADYKCVIDKSTVPVGTADKVKAEFARTLGERGLRQEFDVVSNPEFLKEGAAIADFMKPDRVVIGTESPRALELMRELYAPFTRNHEKLMVMDVRSAELTKYAANSILATKISFMNELSHLAERLGADIEKVRVGIGSDPRIGYGFIYPGTGYGGSCFPKDVQALIRSARDVGYEPAILNAVEAVNARQKPVLAKKILKHFAKACAATKSTGAAPLVGRTFALWGLSFKPNTDDMREAPSLVVIQQLLEAGAKVRAYDPIAREEARRALGAVAAAANLAIVDSAPKALEGADALVILTEWQEFRSPDFDALRKALKQPVIFDGRNLYDPQLMKKLGFTYYAIGRGEPLPVD